MHVQEQVVHNNILYGVHRGQERMQEYLSAWQVEYELASGPLGMSSKG